MISIYQLMITGSVIIGRASNIYFTHDLVKLSQRVTSIEPQFLTVFPQGTEEEKNRFKLLRKAYVDARYKPSYIITQQELEWLAGRVQYLQQLTENLCKEKMSIDPTFFMT